MLVFTGQKTVQGQAWSGRQLSILLAEEKYQLKKELATTFFTESRSAKYNVLKLTGMTGFHSISVISRQRL